MKYIEFIGIPGVGKTTVCNSVCSQLSDYGYKVCNLSQFSYWSHSNMKKIFAVIDSLLNFKLWNSYKKCYKLTKIYQKKVLFCKYFWLLVLITNQLYKFSKKNRYDYIIFDEGIAQIITSISHEKDLVINKYLTDFICVLEKYNIKPALIQCNLGFQECINRIRSRGEKFAVRFSREKSDNKLLLLLQCKDKNIKKVCSLFNVILSIDMNNSMNNNTKLVLNKIKKWDD